MGIFPHFSRKQHSIHYQDFYNGEDEFLVDYEHFPSCLVLEKISPISERKLSITSNSDGIFIVLDNDLQ
ncbi:hypothetical protein NPIL_317571 [Nephila pilipes]|uniref:Uncharacterized protein n=1 Tax=Nephila pilipes TaxID=299642 RepID=A0A8X6JE68_NEPPI|nr:hypothetical protein NPIL_317571 [Nephila pilipes]